MEKKSLTVTNYMSEHESLINVNHIISISDKYEGFTEIRLRANGGTSCIPAKETLEEILEKADEVFIRLRDAKLSGTNTPMNVLVPLREVVLVTEDDTNTYVTCVLESYVIDKGGFPYETARKYMERYL